MPGGQPLTRTRPLPTLLLGSLAPTLFLAGCVRPVAVAPPTPAPGIAGLCAELIAALPEEIVVGPRRDVAPGSELTAAYGDPPVAVRCGVPPPAIGATAELVTVDGIDWLPEELTRGWLLTTVGRAAAVEVTVPQSQGPAPSVAADLGAAIRATIPAQ